MPLTESGAPRGSHHGHDALRLAAALDSHQQVVTCFYTIRLVPPIPMCVLQWGQPRRHAGKCCLLPGFRPPRLNGFQFDRWVVAVDLGGDERPPGGGAVDEPD